jgi:hypothetical protein
MAPEDSKERLIGVTGVVYSTVSAEKEGEARDGWASKPGRMRTKVQNAAVYLTKLPPGWKVSPPEGPCKLVFRHGKIVPSYVCVQAGQKLIVSAEKGEVFSLHYFSRMQPQRGALLPPDQTTFTQTFEKPEDMIVLRCDIHVTAKAHVTVAPNHIFSMTDRNGAFRLPKKLPAGKYVLRAVHPDLGRVDKPILLENRKETVHVDIEFLNREEKK